MLRAEKYPQFVFEGRESSRVSDVTGEVVSEVWTEIGEKTKATIFSVETS